MLDLHVATRTVSGIVLARDASRESAFFVLPPSPRVARDAEGPAIELLRFVRDGQLTGGHLRVTVELAHPPALLAEAARVLAEELRAETVDLAPVPVVGAHAALQFVGRETTDTGDLGSLTYRDYGEVTAHTNAPHRATLSVGLSADGARLMEAALRSGGAPVGVVYRLQVEGLWPATRVLARVDWSRAYTHFSSHARRGSFFTVEDIRRLSERLVEDKVVTIHAVSSVVPREGAETPDVGGALAWVQQQLVERFCEPIMPLAREPAGVTLGTAGEIFGVGSAFAVKSLTQIERGVAEVDLQQGRVIVRTLTAHASLHDLLGDSPPERHVGDAHRDHPFFQRMQLRVDTARPLGDSHVAEALLQFAYGSEQGAARLTADTTDAVFDAWADAAEDRRWRIAPELIFAPDAPLDPGERVQLAPLTGDSRAVTLDLDRLLGLVRIEVQGTADARVALTRVHLVHWRDGSTRASRDLRFAPDQAGQPAWFKDVRPGDRMTAQVEYLLLDGRRLSLGPLPVDTHVFRLPPAFPGAMTVQLLGDDDWGELERVLVAIRKAEDMPTGTFELAGAGQIVPVSLDLPDPADRLYHYRATRVWPGGRVEEDDWATSDASVLVVGRVAASVLRVDVQPVGLDLPAAGIRLIEVDLLYLDVEHQLRATHTVLIRARADSAQWQVPIVDPRRRQYEYRITVHPVAGGTRVGPWTTSSERILPVPIAPA
jgi:hypothetical protein